MISQTTTSTTAPKPLESRQVRRAQERYLAKIEAATAKGHRYPDSVYRPVQPRGQSYAGLPGLNTSRAKRTRRRLEGAR